jgi:hypothetical protein
MTCLNGPESEEKRRERHKKFLEPSADPHTGCMFTILAGFGNASVG